MKNYFITARTDIASLGLTYKLNSYSLFKYAYSNDNLESYYFYFNVPPENKHSNIFYVYLVGNDYYR